MAYGLEQGLDDEYIADKCFVLNDECGDMTFVCVNSVSADLLRRRVENMVRRNIIPPHRILTSFEHGVDGIEAHLSLVPDETPEDIMDIIASEIGLE